MSSTFPSDSPNSRTWWSLAPKQSHMANQDIRKAYSSEKSSSRASKPSTFNVFASAIGFKSKKHPALAIQDPPFPSRPRGVTNPILDPIYTNRPPSKSVSSTQTRDDSLEPRTPLDGQRVGRQSLLTLSDVDPFAVRGVASAPHTPSDPDRLSAYSNSSIPDFISKNVDLSVYNRVSYASSSSHSNAHGSEPSPLSLSSIIPDTTSPKKLKPKRSIGSLHRKQSLVTTDGSLGSAWDTLTQGSRTMSKSGSSVTLTDKNRFSQPDPTPAPRLPMRARGMTDSIPNQLSGFLPTEALPSRGEGKHTSPSSHPPVTSPRVIIRQPSVSRIGLPPSAPPKHELPPPPPTSPSKRDADMGPGVSIPMSSASSSSLSFASSVSSNREVLYNQNYIPRQKEKNRPERTPSGKTEAEISHNTFPTATRTLKKALSHQSLGRRGQSSNHPAHIPLLEPAPEKEKAPRKQRSFHQPKLPLPSIPLPLRHTNSYGAQSSTPSASPVTEQRRGSASGITTSGRKRLFSGSNSRRPSTSQCLVPDDDTRSIFSVRSDPDQTAGTSFFKPMSQLSSPNTIPSFWDETTHNSLPPSPQRPAHEYTPQQILTPAEMAKLEESVEEPSIHARQRGLSILSSSTMITSEGDDESVSGDPPPDPWSNDMLGRSNSMMNKGLSLPPRLSLRSSTSQANMSIRSSNVDRWSSHSSPSTPQTMTMTSLPPPPRRPRPRPSFVSSSIEDVVPSLPPPPGRRNIRTKVSVEKALLRRSIMRKPSFLEIDDDTDDKDTDEESTGNPAEGSFLDFARESFDTVRSISE